MWCVEMWVEWMPKKIVQIYRQHMSWYEIKYVLHELKHYFDWPPKIPRKLSWQMWLFYK